ncbi:MAG: class I SAM-dependent methyltransferase [Patescibacteria group bacterium]
MKHTNSKLPESSTSILVTKCQVCNNTRLEEILFLGYLPPVNGFETIGTLPHEQPSYPAQVLFCSTCHLVQLGLVIRPDILFPKSYPYTSSTTRILRENFVDLYKECTKLVVLTQKDLIIDIGSNDGNLLNNFKDHHKVLGITPEDIGKLAISKGIPTMLEYFTTETTRKVLKQYGRAKIITATNVFAHIYNPNEVLNNIINLLIPDGVFISESHYLYSLIKTIQYDTIYHEHLRYYSLASLKYLLELNGLEIFHAKQIPTHGGSIRVYAARKGHYRIKSTVQALLKKERNIVTKKESLVMFKNRVVLSKLNLLSLLKGIKAKKKCIVGISAPSRATTLINYCGIDDGIIDYVVEVNGSYKIGKYIPGTVIPVFEESKFYEHQPDYALLLSWHIAKEIIPKLKENGYKGKYIIPLPRPRIVSEF